MRELLRVLVLIAALSIAAIGTLLGSIGMALTLLGGGPDRVMTATLSMSVLVLALGLGLASAWHAWRAIQGSPSASFRPKMPWLLLLLFLLAIALGQVVLSFSILPVLTFPLFHIAGSVLPALFILAIAGKALRGASTWRDIVLQISGGVFVAAPLAFVLEAVAMLLIAAAALTGLALQPEGEELLVAVSSYLQDPTLLQDPVALAPPLLTPAVVAIALALLAGLIPLIEEAVKTIGVGLAGYRRPSMPQAVLWGLLAGAGFSIVEGLLNSAGGLGAWLPTVLLRIGTTLLHCLTGALMGLAWYQLVTGRRWTRGLGLYLVSVAIHGLWNGLATVLALLSATATGSGIESSSQLALTYGSLAIMLLLAILAIGLTGGLAGLIVYVRRQSPPAWKLSTAPSVPNLASHASSEIEA